MINHVIPKQGFEIVRDLIGQVLLLELENQKQISNFEEIFSIFCERTTPVNEDEQIVLNVKLNNANYSGLTHKDSQGLTTYFVDVYTNGTSNESYVLLQKYVGLCRYILSHSDNRYLGTTGLIGNSQVNDINFLDQPLNLDSSSVNFARLSLSYRILESQEYDENVNLAGNDTVVKLEETERGYRYTFNN